MLFDEEKKRYARHLSLSNFGEKAQEKLKNAKILVVGAGGLGCPILQYLSAAGVGTIGVVDYDLIDISNLQRQVLYNSSDIGNYKVDVAIQKLKLLNPFNNYIPFKERLTTENAFQIINNFDIVIDGADNFETHFMLGDATLIKNIPLISGAIHKFEGQIGVFNYYDGASFRCAYPTQPNSSEAPNCNDVGVIGVLPGTIGMYMATECVKIITGIGQVLTNKLLVINTFENINCEINVTRNESNFERTKLEPRYDKNCNMNKFDFEITSQQLNELLEKNNEIQLIDVREEFEFEICAIQNSKNIPLSELKNRFSEVNNLKNTVVICHHGIRSAQAINYLSSKGFTNLTNLKGGIHAWATQVDLSMKTY